MSESIFCAFYSGKADFYICHDDTLRQIFIFEFQKSICLEGPLEATQKFPCSDFQNKIECCRKKMNFWLQGACESLEEPFCCLQTKKWKET